MNERSGTHLTEQAYERLKTAIFDGSLPPGTPLSRRRLAEELGMSTVPVGDAIVRLQSEGFIECRPQAGTRVRIATPEEIRGNYVLREALETHSARLFAEAAGDRHRQRLLQAAHKLDLAYSALRRNRAGRPAAHARVERRHIALHMLVAQASQVPVLIAAIERSRVLLFNWIFTLSTDVRALPERWHRDLAHVLVHGTPHAATEAMRAHVRFRQEEVIARFRDLAEQTAGTSRMLRGPQRRTLGKDGARGILA